MRLIRDEIIRMGYYPCSECNEYFESERQKDSHERDVHNE